MKSLRSLGRFSRHDARLYETENVPLNDKMIYQLHSSEAVTGTYTFAYWTLQQSHYARKLYIFRLLDICMNHQRSRDHEQAEGIGRYSNIRKYAPAGAMIAGLVIGGGLGGIVANHYWEGIGPTILGSLVGAACGLSVVQQELSNLEEEKDFIDYGE